MPHIMLSQQRGKDSILEMASFITENTSRVTKPSEDISVNELHHCFSIILLFGNYFHPFRHIVDDKKDIQFPKRMRKRSHEVNSLYIENLYFLNVV